MRLLSLVAAAAALSAAQAQAQPRSGGPGAPGRAERPDTDVVQRLETQLERARSMIKVLESELTKAKDGARSAERRPEPRDRADAERRPEPPRGRPEAEHRPEPPRERTAERRPEPPRDRAEADHRGGERGGDFHGFHGGPPWHGFAAGGGSGGFRGGFHGSLAARGGERESGPHTAPSAYGYHGSPAWHHARGTHDGPPPHALAAMRGGEHHGSYGHHGYHGGPAWHHGYHGSPAWHHAYAPHHEREARTMSSHGGHAELEHRVDRIIAELHQLQRELRGR